MRLWNYPSISIFNPDLSSTVKWSSQTMIRSSQRFTRASSKASKCAGCCLIKSCSSLMRAICASLATVSTVHFSRCSRSLKISSAISSYPERRDDKHLIKTIHFTFPVTYDGESGALFVRTNEQQVESVVLLSK